MKLFETIKNYNTVRKNGHFLKIVADIFKFVETTHKEHKPMTCEIALINVGNEMKIGSFVSLWAGIGKASPIERCQHLKAQNIELIRLLRIAREGDLSEENKICIDVTIKCFDK